MPKKRYPLAKRFNVAMSEKAYKNLRKLNDKYYYGNNYLLTILLENLDAVTDEAKLDKVFAKFQAEYGAPSGNTMKSKQ